MASSKRSGKKGNQRQLLYVHGLAVFFPIHFSYTAEGTVDKEQGAMGNIANPEGDVQAEEEAGRGGMAEWHWVQLHGQLHVELQHHRSPYRR
jgi:hypothetical protein